ncbi:hypothetical protein C8F01DRAFT_1157876 [Mycena amicta]|nr:hypothetical protein C8F01DRAFT_1157876 [Mycena amicta]
MLLRFPRRGVKRKKSPLVPDVLNVSLFALKESADAFPPLKSAVGGVLAVWDVADRMKHCKSKARTIALRTTQILDVMAEAIPDASKIPDPLLQSIERFTSRLDDVRQRMEDMNRLRGLSRFVNLRQNERVLQDILGELDDTYRDFMTALALRVEVQQFEQTQLMKAHMPDQIQLGKMSNAMDELLTGISHLKWIVFFSRPLAGVTP